jgi:hypothetical protein
MRHLGYFAALALSGSTLAHPVSQAPWMTGAQLMQKLRGAADSAEAVAYLKGVVDSTADRQWCYSQSKPGSAQLQPVLMDKLRALPPAQAQRSAAELAVEAWRERWPCPPHGCCHA